MSEYPLQDYPLGFFQSSCFAAESKVAGGIYVNRKTAWKAKSFSRHIGENGNLRK